MMMALGGGESVRGYNARPRSCRMVLQASLRDHPHGQHHPLSDLLGCVARRPSFQWYYDEMNRC